MKTLESTRRFIRTWCKSRDIEVVESKLVVVPHAVYNKKTKRKLIYLPLISSVNFEEWQRISYHESSHLADENIWHYEVMHAVGKEENIMASEIANVFVDNLAERVDFREYIGRARNLSSARAVHGENLGKIMRKNVQDDQHLLRSALLRWDMKNREKWMINFSMPVAHEPLPHLSYYDNELKRFKLDEMMDALAASDDTEDKIESLTKLCLEIDKLIASRQQNPEQGESDDSTDSSEDTEQMDAGAAESDEEDNADASEGGEEDSQSSASSSGDEAGHAEPGEGSQSDETPLDNDQESVSQSQMETNPGGDDRSQHGNEKAEESQGGYSQCGEGNNVEYTEEEKKALENYNQDIERELDVKRNISEVQEHHYQEGRSSYYIPCNETDVVKISEDTENLLRKKNILELSNQTSLDKSMRKHLQLLTTGRAVHGTKKGKLSTKKLHTLYNRSANQVQPLVFKQQQHGRVKLDTAVTLLEDMSGSMGSSHDAPKYNLAAASVLSVAEVLSGLRIKHEILGFTHEWKTNTIYVLKEFYERALTKDKLAARLSSSQIHQDYNTDGEALQFAAERIMRMKEQNKVIIVLSDGMPAGDYDGDGAYYLKEVVKDIEKNSPIHLCSIGIKSDEVRRFYKNYKIIYHMEQLEGALLETLKTNILTT